MDAENARKIARKIAKTESINFIEFCVNGSNTFDISKIFKIFGISKFSRASKISCNSTILCVLAENGPKIEFSAAVFLFWHRFLIYTIYVNPVKLCWIKWPVLNLIENLFMRSAWVFGRFCQVVFGWLDRIESCRWNHRRDQRINF